MDADIDKLERNLRAALIGDWQRDAVMLQAAAEAHLDEPAAIRCIGRLMQEILPGVQRRQLVRALCLDSAYCAGILDSVDSHIAAGRAVQALQELEPLQEAEEVFLHNDATCYFAFANLVEISYFHATAAPTRAIRVPSFPFNRYYLTYIRALRRLGSLPSCLGVADRALVRNPTFGDVLLQKAAIQAAIGQRSAARDTLVQALPLLYRSAQLARYFTTHAELLAAAGDRDGALSALYAAGEWQGVPPDPALLRRAARSDSADTPTLAPYAGTWAQHLQDRVLPYEPDLTWGQVAAHVAQQAWDAGDMHSAGLAWTVLHELTGDTGLTRHIAACREKGGHWD